MSFTQAEASKYTQNQMKAGVLEELVKDSNIMQRLRFIDVTGNAYQYTRENSMGTADFYDPNELISEDTGDVTSVTAAIKILAGDADIDNFLRKTRSDKTDFEASEIDRKAKALKWKFLDTFWYGDSSANSKSFDGLNVLLNALPARTVNQGGALSITTMEDQFDTILGGMPDGLWMSKRLRTLITRYMRSKAINDITRNDFGEKVTEFNNMPIYVEDHLTLTETASVDSVTSPIGSTTMSLFALAFGEDDILGLQNGGLSIKNLGQLEGKDSRRWRLIWYVGLALQRTIRQARVHAITNSAVVD
jgi:hypothetical protein